MARRFWTPEEDRLALDPSLSAIAAAAKMGRSVTSVYSRRQVLRGTSSKPRWRAEGVPQAPRGHPEWLIAKSCLQCGQLLGASQFSVRIGGGRNSYCKACQSERVSDRRATDPEFRARFDAHVTERQKALQATARRSARNHRKQWTGPELELVMRDDLTDKEKAEMLGRSFYAVRHIIRKIRSGDPIKVHLAGLSQDS